MNRVMKRFVSSVVALALLLQPVAVYAGGAKAFFDSLLSDLDYTQKDRGRTVVRTSNLTAGSLGGFQITPPRSPKKQYIGISITPPSLSITETSCGIAVDGFFGGLSFISNVKMDKLIKGMTQGAVTFVLHMVLKVIAPLIESILQMLQKLAQMAAKLNIDACGMGRALAQKMTGWSDGDPADAQKRQDACAKKQTEQGGSADMVSAITDDCSLMDQAMAKMKSAMNWADDKQQKVSNFMKGVQGVLDPSSVAKDLNDLDKQGMGAHNYTFDLLGGSTACSALAATGVDTTSSIKLLSDSGVLQGSGPLTCQQIVLVMNMLGVWTSDMGMVTKMKASDADVGDCGTDPTCN